MYSRKAGGGSGPITTAWVKPSQKPSEPANRSKSTPKKSQGMAKHTKSPEVTKVEKLIEAIETGVDPKAGQTGCFCMDHDRAAMLITLEDEKAHQLAVEAEQREHERIERQRQKEIQAGGGAFPSLAASTGSGSSPLQGRATPTNDGGGGSHKVLSLNSRTKHVTVRTITPSTSAPTSRPASRAATAEELAEKERLKPVPPRPDEINYVKDASAPGDRPWMNLCGPTLTYIPVEPDPSSLPAPGEKKKRAKRGGKKNTNLGAPGAASDVSDGGPVVVQDNKDVEQVE
ncbi:hypothetical protein FRB96_005500 [Tulasnella sp. 330]|nr:hypothetical protein FRB96_005500 [Tulasnella sp. 330]KAG8877400.1 hypothetical protein FRB97_003441 [Tulasnella sp. 331]KAG8884169.1 hypothetical protein FRB98_002585 [Tulasnella sp. 332]